MKRRCFTAPTAAGNKVNLHVFHKTTRPAIAGLVVANTQMEVLGVEPRSRNAFQSSTTCVVVRLVLISLVHGDPD